MAKIKGVRWRERAVDILVRSPLVTTNFLLRTSFSGSTKTAEKSMRELRQELVDVVLASDYGLDVRGDANASTRLYEILSLGRIPVLIDTERILPFSDTVNYQSFSLIVDSKDIEHLPQKIKTFHDSLTDEEFMAMQEHARAAFVEHFRPDKWMPHIIKELKTKGVFSQ
jgi:hypothetical protein